MHTLVLNHIKSKLGSKKNEKKQEALFADIDAVFREVAQANKLSTGDFPTAKLFTDSFAVRALHFPISHLISHTNLKSPCAEQKYDFAAYEPVHPKLVHAVDQLLVTELPLLMKMLPTDAECRAWEAEDAGGAAKAAATASTEEGAVLEALAKVRARPPARLGTRLMLAHGPGTIQRQGRLHPIQPED